MFGFRPAPLGAPARPRRPGLLSAGARGAFALCALLALAGCGGGGGGRGPSNRPSHPLPAEPLVFQGPVGEFGGRIVVSTIGAPKTFNVMISNETTTTDIISNLVFEGILDYDNVTQEVTPGLASRWELSADQKTWTFHLREGLRWSDGTPLTTDDVMFTVEVLQDSVIHPAAGDLLRTSGSFPEFRKVDDRTFTVTLQKPYGPFLHMVSAPRILPKHKLESAFRAGRFSETWGIDTPPDSLVSNGAFVVTRYVPNQMVVLGPNPWYYKVDTKNRRLPYIDELVWVVVPDQNAEVIKFRSGETDAIYLRAEDFQTLKDGEAAGGYTVLDLGPEFGTNFFWFNQNGGTAPNGRPLVDPVKRSWFTNRQFRLAVAHAVDRESIIRNVFNGLAEPLSGPIPPGNRIWYNEGITTYPYDLERAKQLLTEAGFVDRDGDGVVEDPEGRKVSFRFWTNAGNKERIGSGTIISEDLRKIGLDVQFQALEFNMLVDAIQKTGDYDAMMLGGTGGNPPDPAMITNTLRSSGATHYWWPRQPRPMTAWEAEIDSLVDVHLSNSQVAARKPAVDRIQQIFAEQVPAVFTVGRKGMLALRSKVKNARPSVFRPYAVWNAEELWVDPKAARETASR